MEEKIYDKNGVEITDGCTIYNEWDRDKYHKVAKDENGNLCFESDMTIIDKRYATDRFWEVVPKREEETDESKPYEHDIKLKLLTAIEIIIDKYPLKHDHAEDGRYTYPDRWSALVKYIMDNL